MQTKAVLQHRFMASFNRPFLWFYREFGLKSIHDTGRDAYLIILARTCRMFAYGTTSLMLALFFNEMAFSDSRIGMFMTLTMVGDVFLGIVLTIIADHVGRRKIMFGGSFLMVLSGAVFAYFENFWILLFAAVVGVVSTTGGDFGPFRAIEESVLSQLTTPESRSDVLSWYVTFSTWGSSLGSEASGRLIQYTQNLDGWSLARSYHMVFAIYIVMGFVNAGLVALLTQDCEAPIPTETYTQIAQDDADDSFEMVTRSSGEELLAGKMLSPSSWSNLWPSWLTNSISTISTETRVICYKLWILLFIDSLSDGMVPYSLTNYYMNIKFQPAKATLGDVTSIAFLLSAIGTVFAGPLARSIGLINTMVFTHIPSSAAVLFFPLPDVLWATVLLLFVRAGLNNMDQAPRAAFIAGSVKPGERTAVLGITSTLRGLGSTAGPTVTGILASSGHFWVAFVVGGACRLGYDIGLYVLFVNTTLHKHEGPSNTETSISSSPVAGKDEPTFDGEEEYLRRAV